MSEENVEIVRRVFDADAHRNTKRLLALYDPGVEIDNTHGPAQRLMGKGRVYRGYDGLRTFFRDWYGAWESMENDVEELIDTGDQVISVLTLRARGRVSGAEVELAHAAAVWTVRDGKVVRAAWFKSREEALKAAGLTE